MSPHPTPPSTAGSFRADIEGLRAIAVLAVLAYHARIPGIPGGYIGVDVFFVVSGFLITGLILRELQRTGTLSLPAFYARRARRLLPAALVVIAATVLASAVVLPPLRVGDVALDGAASALYVGNIRYAMQATDYLQAEAAPSPLLHFWSLGVEEQFYLVWPALLLLAAGRSVDRRRIAAVILAVGIGSLALSVVLTPTDSPLAFFLLPTRAWELALGAGLALAAGHLARAPAAMAEALVAAGLVAVGVAAVTYDLGTPFPGTAAILPVLGAGLIVAGGTRPTQGRLSRWLGLGPLRWIGGISYSLYLWHWPLLVLPAAAIGAPLPGVVRLGLVVLTFGLAAASRRWVEDPIRHGAPARLASSRMLAAAGALSVAAAVGALGIGAVVAPPASAATSADVVLELPSGGWDRSPSNDGGASTDRPTTSPGPVPDDLVPALGAVRDDLPVVYDDGCHASASDRPPITRIDSCVYGEPASDTTVVLIGDSHAAHWFPTLERLALERRWRLVSLTKSGCPSIDAATSIWNVTLKRAYDECPLWLDQTLERIDLEDADLVVISNARSTRFLLDGEAVRSTEREDLWGAGLRATIAEVAATGAEVVVIGDTPDPRGDPPVCLSDHLDDAAACATPFDEAVDEGRQATERGVAQAEGATYIDPTGWLCPSDPCPSIIGRLLVYRDEHHMTTPFARALAPYLEPMLPHLAP
ncbi:MAG: acyltransferase family protein [Candidatus Limnocylindria bacterium]